MNAEGAAGVEKAGLPKNRQIEKTFDQNHVVVITDQVPGEETAFGTWKESAGRRAAETAAIEIDMNPSELGFSEGGPELLKLGSPVQKFVIPHRIDLATSGTVQ